MRRAAALALLMLAPPASAGASPALAPVGDFAQPVSVAAPPADADRLFVVQQTGQIRLVKGGVVQREPWADLSADVQAGGEQGLLGLAFAPDYAATRLAYVFLTARAPSGEIQIRELRRSADPDRAAAGPGRLVMSIPHPEAANHNGGQLAFGPDGYLYAGVGDGGNANDTPISDADNRGSLRGKILRIDPRQQAGAPYAVPAGNPFGTPVWALGLRNPWRFSFDRATGTLLAGDVGQNAREEIDAIVGGGDYGWHCWEGTLRTPSTPGDRGSPPLCPTAPARTPPLLEHDHGDGSCSIIGGFVVRDPGLPTLLGRYLYGDYCKDGLRSMLPDGRGDRAEPGLSVAYLSSLGEDACGRLYAASLGGSVQRIVDGAATPCLSPPPPPAAPPVAPGSAAPDTRACVVRVRRRPHQPARPLRLRLRADEACRVTLRARRYKTRTLALRAQAWRLATLHPTRAGRRALRHRRGLLVTIRIATRDRAGNLGSRRAHVRVRS